MTPTLFTALTSTYISHNLLLSFVATPTHIFLIMNHMKKFYTLKRKILFRVIYGLQLLQWIINIGHERTLLWRIHTHLNGWTPYALMLRHGFLSTHTGDIGADQAINYLIRKSWWN